ncbi:hypothetical protein QBC44DRAFT_379452 [Cladorrhinum sp. PSN332]|nr:hypothetical protein QBC44DRAFT_379452 [Cladorrhinum sp. PSN332]
MGQSPESTLEVALPEAGQDIDKMQVPIDKEAVPGQAIHHRFNPGTIMDNKGTKNGSTGATASTRGRIMGMKRGDFLVVAWIISIIIAVAAGVGGSLGATAAAASSRHSCPAAPLASTSTTDDTLHDDSSPPPQNSTSSVLIPSSSPSEASTTTPSLRVSLTQATSSFTSTTSESLPIPPTDIIIGGPGGRCSNEWGRDCICLDSGVCKYQWQGEPKEGPPENRPCPGDSGSSIMGCIVRPCLGKSTPAQCLWKEACRKVFTDPDSRAGLNCPGAGADFVCCEHSWLNYPD